MARARQPSGVRRIGPLAMLLAAIGPGELRGEVDGGITLGWRSVDVDGDRTKYRQHLNYDDGAWLKNLELDWRAAERPDESWRPDTLALRVSDLGGEPFERSRLTLERTGRYRLTYQRSVSEYVYDDLLIRPEDASIEASTGGDYRRFDFERVRDHAAFELQLAPRTEFALDYRRDRRDGDGTAPLDVSREEFVVERPIDETSQTVAASIAHTGERFSVTWTERYRRFDFDSSMFLAGFSEGLDPDGPTTLETYLLEQPYELEGFEHELSARIRPTQRLSLTGNVVLADVDVSLRALERVVGTDFTGAPLDERLTGRGDLDQQRRLIDIGASYAASDRLALFARVRAAEFEQSAALTYQPEGAADWDIDSVRLEAGAETALGRTLRAAVGAASESRDVAVRQQAEPFVDAADVDTDADGYFVRLWYRPVRRAELHLSWEDDSIDDPFTLASATSAERLRLRGRYRWPNGLSLTASYLDVDRRNDRSGWVADAERFDLRLAYAGTRLSWSAGAGRTDLSRSVDSLVVGGSRTVPFDLRYGARADTLDVAVSWRITERVTAGGSHRRFDNDRSFEVDRDDWRVFLRGRLDERYRWGLEYRDVDFQEGGIEDFRARLVEVSVGVDW